MAFMTFCTARARTRASALVKAPSRNTGSLNRLVVAMPSFRPVSRNPCWKRFTIRSRSWAPAPGGTRSSSCRLTPQAPSSASFSSVRFGSSGSRTGPPNGSRPTLPTVHSPKLKRSPLVGVSSFTSCPPIEKRRIPLSGIRRSAVRLPSERAVGEVVPLGVVRSDDLGAEQVGADYRRAGDQAKGGQFHGGRDLRRGVADVHGEQRVAFHDAGDVLLLAGPADDPQVAFAA